MFALNFTRASKQNMLAACLAVLTAAYALPTLAATDPVVLTFSTVGDSRQDPQNPDYTQTIQSKKGVGNCPVPYANTAAGVTPATVNGLTPNPGLTGQDCLWQQNSKAWARIMRSIQAQKSNLLFFNGDMIMGYGKADVPVTRTSNGKNEVAIANPTVDQLNTSDLVQNAQQYSFWRGMVANMIETGTYVVPVPGNHETQCKRCSKFTQVANENAWRFYMGDLILDQDRLNNALGLANTGLSLKNTKGINTFSLTNNPYVYGQDFTKKDINNNTVPTSDQSQLSYSFDVGASHFVVINTDPYNYDGNAPALWLDADLHTAVTNGAKNLFVFGHKPYRFYSYPGGVGSSTSSLELASKTNGDAFWSVINNHKATYFSGHEHTYNVSQPTVNGSYQVIVGSGGSPFDDLQTSAVVPAVNTPTDRYYAWATVSIRQSGAVSMTTYGFDPTVSNPIQTIATYTLPTGQ